MPMNEVSASINIQSHVDWRRATAAQIADGLQILRCKILQVFDAYVAADCLTVPYADTLNPPLWELGHIAWFQEYWIGRNQERHLGIHCDAKHTRLPSVLVEADSWYNSSLVPHAARWHLPLPEPEASKEYLAETLNQTLRLLEKTSESDDALYFYRLVLFHEAMHLEAGIYMAQALGIKIATDLIASKAINTLARGQFNHIKQVYKLGYGETGLNAGFAFDNELEAHVVQLDAFAIDSRCVNWGEYMQFVEATAHRLPRYVRRSLQSGESSYEKQLFGVWQPLDLQATAVHINYADAQAYCAWAGRRLPTEAEWELAASKQTEQDANVQYSFVWGDVWEWTSSTFAPYLGFVAHPYVDYSEPWFGTRKVLRGACAATQPMMKNVKYRNYFPPERDDIYAGFRTCAL